jgi:uncharacterized repeat protein (TIGR01451 family)
MAIGSRVTGFAVRLALAAAALWTLLGPRPVGAGELVQNGSFEAGSFGTWWVHGAHLSGVPGPNYADHAVLPDLPFSGSYSALLGFKYTTQQTGAGGYMYQQVAVPSNISRATLYFKVRMQGYDSTPYDPFYAQIRRTDDTVWQTILTLTFPEYNYIFKDSGWLDDNNALPVGYDMTSFAGNTVRVYFEQANTIDALYETWSFVDDVSLVYKRWVDLAVDGNGDDAFGDLGTGLGGASYRAGLPEDSVVFDLDVENEGPDADTYVLSAAAPSGWTVLLDTGSGLVSLPFATGPFTSGEVASWEVVVVPPVSTPAGQYAVIVDAVSGSQGNRYDSVRLGVNVLDVHYGADLVVEGNGFGVVGDDGTGGFALKAAPWDSTVSYAIQLINTGEVAATYRVSWTSEPGVNAVIRYQGVPQASPFTTAAIPSDSAAVMTLEASSPNPEPGGDYQTIVRAAAVADTLERDSVRGVLRLRAPRIDLVIGANGDGIYDDTFSGLGGSSSNAGERGTAVLFPVLVQNESSVPDSVTLSWVGPGGGWTAELVDGAVTRSFPYSTPAIPANAHREYALRIFIPGGASFSTFPSRLNAVSRTDNRVSESVSAVVSVSAAGQVDMAIDGSGLGIYGPIGTGLGGSSTRTFVPGDSTVFSIDLRNISGTNQMNVFWQTPPGWRVTFAGLPSPVSAIPAGVYDFKVVVPASAPAGTVSLIVDAQKTDKPFYMDSVIGRVTVFRPRAVDAVIDGDGNGAYGPLGSGLGGSSEQSHSAPASLSFTVEIQNEGADGDQYEVTWNQIPFWQARLGGSTSPFITGTIAPGSFALYTFEVTVPPNADPGDYAYIIDLVSLADAGVVESIEARVHVAGPPRVDLVIDGSGAGIFGVLGSGEGGVSVHGSAPAGSYTATLDVRNVGSFADSFTIFWEPPSGWPAGSVLLNDGTNDLASPIWTPVIGPGGSRPYTVRVSVPADAGVGVFTTIINATSSLPPNSPESVKLLTQTAAVVQGVVFDDRDHDGAFGTGDVGLGGVAISETSSGSSAASDGGGRFSILIAGGPDVTVIETNPSGWVSVTPDTVGPVALGAGDTLIVAFADVSSIRLSSGAVSNGVAGGYADFAHIIDAGTRGPVTLTASSDPAAGTMFFLDVNGDGVLDGGDRPLEAPDLLMDPDAGKDRVSVILRVFIPAPSPVGATYTVRVEAIQSIDGTPLSSEAEAFDAVVVVENASGLITLQKRVDTAAAAPGATITYTIEFSNSGLDSVQNIVILDPVSPYVDPAADAFGPGMDVEWRKGGMATVYLTFAGDGDECEYTGHDRLLRLILSRNAPYALAPGESGEVAYRVIVK